MKCQVSLEMMAFLAIEILLLALAFILAFYYLLPLYEGQYSMINDVVQKAMIFYTSSVH
ncbi:MAG: hypothetical protein GXO42_00090 [bacterium]|nr:hypothetical protein [bacterium]